jgi:hypothetical protein
MCIAKRPFSLLPLLLFLAVVLFACNSASSAPEQQMVETTALQLANAAPPRYATAEFKITNHYVKEIDKEKVFVYETQFKIKNTETDKVYGPVDMGIGIEPLFYSTFGLVKRGEKWYPMQ